MKWFTGTSGFSYKEWKGSFYPDDIAADEMLAFYATQLGAVEINNTFYRMPRTSVIESWASAVPNDFRFAIKASRRITHQSRLKNCEEPVGYLAKAVEVLEDKLGAVLFQLAPAQRKDIERLRAFLDLWPEGLPAAFEFRNASWFDDETLDLLADRGITLCVSEDGELALPERIGTSDRLYLRLRKAEYDTRALNGWLRKANATGADTGLAFFKHEDAGAGPELARRFLSLADKPTAKRAPKRTADRAAPKRAPAKKTARRRTSG